MKGLLQRGGNKVKQLDKCPECSSHLHEGEHVQICGECGYWTRKGTARLDAIDLFTWGCIMNKTKGNSCPRCKCELKRQVLGINRVFYCPFCGNMTSDELAWLLYPSSFIFFVFSEQCTSTFLTVSWSTFSGSQNFCSTHRPEIFDWIKSIPARCNWLVKNYAISESFVSRLVILEDYVPLINQHNVI